VLKAMAKAPEQRYDTASEMGAALSSIDLVDDDAISLVTRDPTPPEGITPTFAQTERTWLIPVVAIVLIALALGTVGVLFARTGEVRDFLDRADVPSGDAPAAVELVDARAFDPLGDNEEHNGEARNVIDGDPTTTWRTERYSGRTLGKPGVGIVVQVADAQELRRVEVASATRGYSASVYVADAAQDTLEGWAEPVATKAAVDGDATFDLVARRGAAVLVWITALGETSSVQIGEVRVLA
jgi:hypothetical protein